MGYIKAMRKKKYIYKRVKYLLVILSMDYRRKKGARVLKDEIRKDNEQVSLAIEDIYTMDQSTRNHT